MEKLKLLARAKDFTVEDCDGYYEITMVNSNIAATIAKRDSDIGYYLTGCCNSGIDWRSIDIDDFEKLKAFCKLMVK